MVQNLHLCVCSTKQIQILFLTCSFLKYDGLFERFFSAVSRSLLYCYLCFKTETAEMQLLCSIATHHWTYEIHSVGVDKRNVEIQRFKRERVLFCFSNLSDKTVKKACQIFSSLVYFCQFSFQFNLEK